MSGDPLYSSARWRRLRARHLAKFPLCETCGTEENRVVAARCVDHRKAVSQGGDPFPDHGGLASLCWKHHSQKTARGAEAGAVRSSKPKRGCNADGSPLDPEHPWNAHTGGGRKASKRDHEQPPPNTQTQLVNVQARKGERNG
jgi:5-methylcytosine-specific restriction protein A